MPVFFVVLVGFVMVKEIDLKTMARPEAQVVVAPRPSEEHPGDLLMVNVIGGAMNPQYKDRLEPLVRTLMAYCEQRVKEERLLFPANTPPLIKGTLKRQ